MIIDISDLDYPLKIKTLQALYNVRDPELNINIVDLGLVYGIEVNTSDKMINITMTLSSPSCPLGGIIVNHVKVAVEEIIEHYTVNADIVWEPVWNYDKITPEGKKELGL